jgi:hypothetical protein
MKSISNFVAIWVFGLGESDGILYFKKRGIFLINVTNGQNDKNYFFLFLK